ncbi:hypothetical protein BAE44_0005955, partial [Dichanthelium oligosanthes]
LHDRGVAHLRLHAPPPRDALADPRPDVAARVRVPALSADAAVAGRRDAGHQPPRPRPVTQESTDAAASRRHRRCVDTAGVGEIWRGGGEERRKQQYNHIPLARTQNLSSKLILSSSPSMLYLP